MSFKKSMLSAVLLSTVLSSPSLAYFGESLVNGVYDKASSAVSWVKQNPGKAALGVAALGAASYFGYISYVGTSAQGAPVDANHIDEALMKESLNKVFEEIFHTKFNEVVERQKENLPVFARSFSNAASEELLRSKDFSNEALKDSLSNAFQRASRELVERFLEVELKELHGTAQEILDRVSRELSVLKLLESDV